MGLRVVLRVVCVSFVARIVRVRLNFSHIFASWQVLHTYFCVRKVIRPKEERKKDSVRGWQQDMEEDYT